MAASSLFSNLTNPVPLCVYVSSPCTLQSNAYLTLPNCSMNSLNCSYVVSQPIFLTNRVSLQSFFAFSARCISLWPLFSAFLFSFYSAASALTLSACFRCLSSFRFWVLVLLSSASCSACFYFSSSCFLFRSSTFIDCGLMTSFLSTLLCSMMWDTLFS